MSLFVNKAKIQSMLESLCAGDADTRQATIAALAKLRRRGVRPLLLLLAGEICVGGQASTDPPVPLTGDLREASVAALGGIGKPAVKPLMEALRSVSAGRREAAVDALAAIGAPAVPAVVELLQREIAATSARQDAARILGRIGSDDAAGALVAVLEQPKLKSELSETVIAALGGWGTEAVEPLAEVLYNVGDEAAEAIAVLLGELGDQRAGEALADLARLETRSDAARQAAIRSIVLLRYGKANGILMGVSSARETSSALRQTAAWALRRNQERKKEELKRSWEKKSDPDRIRGHIPWQQDSM